MPPQQQKIRRMVLTGSIAAITACGAWYGAGLKTKQEIRQVAQKQREATPAESIALLEEQRGTLVAKKIGLERKIQELQMRANGATREQSKLGKERRR